MPKPKSTSRPSARNLFSRKSYDADAPSYTSVPTAGSLLSRSDDDRDEDDEEGEEDEASVDDILREEEEREKLLSGGIFGSLGRSAGSKVKVGKVDKRGRRRKKVGDVVGMMGGKRLGMEEGGEYGIGDEESEDDEEEFGGVGATEKDWEKKPRAPTLRRVLMFITLLLSFLLVLIFSSLALTHHRKPLPVLTNGTHPFHPTTIIISLDGLRADFLSRNLTPTLDSFVNSGVSPEYMLPSFPSVTFPNHWTIVTGLYPESHGIVGNSFWDPSTKKEFYYTDPARSHSAEWWGGEPLWVTAEKQGIKSAVHMWPGSEANSGWGATYIDTFNGSEVLSHKVDRILEWMDKPLNERPQFMAAYVPNIDAVGHKFGPNTTETDETVKSVDDMLASLFHGFEQRNLTDIINIIIVSDHGMASTSNDRLIYLDSIIDMNLIEHVDGWPLYGLRPFPHVSLTDLHATLKAEANAQKEGEKHWDVYLRDEDMPDRWHFSANERIAPLWIVPETGWAIVTKKEFDITSGRTYHPAGLHGYDNLHPLMRAIFVARGPAFAHLHGEGKEWLALGGDDRGTKGEVRAGRVAPFGNWEVYRMVCKSLGMAENINNATMEEFKLLENTEEGEADEVVEVGNGDSDNSDANEKEKIEDQQPSTLKEGVKPTPTPISSQDSETGNKIGIDEPTSAPSRPTVDKPDEGKDGEDIDIEAMNWLDYIKWKSEKLKNSLNKWWDKVWTGVGHNKEHAQEEASGQGNEE